MVTMMVDAKLSPEKIDELVQTLDTIKKDLEGSECRMNFTLSRQMEEPSSVSIVFEWENERDFECSLRKDEIRVVCGAVKVLCEESIFCCNSHSEKWSSLDNKREPNQMGSVTDGNMIFMDDAAVNTQISLNNESE